MSQPLLISTIDIGTNTVLALDAQVGAAGALERLADHLDIVRLGEGLDASGRLQPAAIERALAVLERHGARIAASRPDAAAAVATEAVRTAANAGEFLERAGRALRFPVEVIGGEREARLSWLATARSIPAPPGLRRTVLEIGGGSTQLMQGEAAAEAPEAARSVPIGSVRLTERIVRHDPPGAGERRALVEAIDGALAVAPAGGELVGIAGTITTLCAIHLALADYDADRVHGQVMSRADVERVVARLGAMTQEERLRLPGLDPRRADVIWAGGVIALRVMERGEFPALTVSDRGIRWGLAHEIAARAGRSQRR
jgi:exopolyphosphatase / guanosine-5'-triphosphate,3'-diphosphate pyrophosphatase